jgi:septal ring factor EnvC (AmiA/AmiB activator)
MGGFRSGELEVTRTRRIVAGPPLIAKAVFQLSLVGLLSLGASGWAQQEAPSESQLETVKSRIRSLRLRLSELDREEVTQRAVRERLNSELELAIARVEELEIVLTGTRDEAARLRAEADQMAEELRQRKALLAKHLEMVALLGEPGPLQLIYDATRGGELEQAVSAVTVLTTGQIRLMEEYAQLQKEHATRLANLSRVLGVAQREAKELTARRRELERVRKTVDTELRRLERNRTATSRSLEEMEEREAALQRLMAVVSQKNRLSHREDIRKYRGALPWPAPGNVVQTFGRHYMEQYSAYRVCNGLRIHVESGHEVNSVFTGEVAYAQFFKGYGNMVIVDHGHGVFSLVAGLATIHVRRDQRVLMGTRLGLAAPSEDEGNLYFEVRVDNEPQDPRRWLQLAGGKSSR